MHLLIYCLPADGSLTWSEASALQRLQPLLALVPLALSPRAMRREDMRSVKRRFERDSIAASVRWWKGGNDAVAQQLLDAHPLGPPPLFLVMSRKSAAAERGGFLRGFFRGAQAAKSEPREEVCDLGLLTALLFDHILPTGVAIAQCAVEERERDLARSQGLGLGVCAGVIVGALAAIGVLRAFKH